MKKIGLTEEQLEALQELVNQEIFRTEAITNSEGKELVEFLKDLMVALNSAIDT